MGKRRTPARNPQGGRPTVLLQPGVHRTLVEAIELGVPVYIACQGVGVSTQSFRNWMHRGNCEHEAQAEGAAPNEDEKPYRDLYLAVLEARSKAAFRNVGVIQKAAQGGTVTEKTVRRYTDHDGNDVEEETVKRAGPDWRAAAWYLERAHRSEYGKDATQVEITGLPGGGDDQNRPGLPGDTGDPAVDLAARLSAFIAANVPQLPVLEAASTDDDGDDIVDAEVAED